MNVNNLLPESINIPRVGHSVYPNGVVSGAYDIVSNPTLAKTVPKDDAGMLSMLTMSRDRTSLGLASSHVFTIGYRVLISKRVGDGVIVPSVLEARYQDKAKKR